VKGGMGHREAILEAATALFHEQGFSRTSTEEVAAQAHITKRTLYRYFSSKEKILLAIHEEALGHLLKPVDLHGEIPDQLTDLLQNYINTVAAHGPEIQVFFEERKHLSEPNLTKVVQLRDQHEEVFRETIRKGISKAVFRQLDVPIVTEGILGAVASMYEWYRPDGALTAADIGDTASALFLHGLSAVTARTECGAAAADKRQGLAAKTPVIELSEHPTWDENPVLSRILDAASALFYEHGYDKASTRDLADAAQLTKSALYYYIPNKESILFQLNLRLTVRGIESLTRISRDNSDPVDTLREIVLWQCQTIAENLGALRALSYEMRFLDADHYSEIKRLRSEYARLFGAAVRAAAGVRSPDGNTNVTGMLILGMLNFMHHWYTDAGRLSPAQIGEGFFDLIWHGMRDETAGVR
jgi:AcrR family transcriptional regulator